MKEESSLKKVLAISGSTRANSTNHQLINAIKNLSANLFSIEIYDRLASLPIFNPDENGDAVAKEVIHFRQLIKDAVAVIICTPEYAHGVPGALKNAIDWTVSSNEFYEKPTMLITASTDGRFAHQALLETLRTIGCTNSNELQLVIQFAKTKIVGEKIIDQKTLDEIQELINTMASLFNSDKTAS